MLLFYIVLFLLVAVGLRQRRATDLQEALSPSQANVVKGLFILWIFLLHTLPFLRKSGYGFTGLGDELLPYLQIQQASVVMFLFYSGYGVCHQLLHKEGYVRSMPRHRILKTLLNFDIAVLCFLVLSWIQQQPHSPKEIFLACLGWQSLRNGSWYIFVILVLYTLTYLVHLLPVKDWLHTLFLLSLCLILTLCLYKLRPSWWYNTIFCYAGGYLLCKYKSCVAPVVQRKSWMFLLVCIGCGILAKALFMLLVMLGREGQLPAWASMPWLWTNLFHLSIAGAIVALLSSFEIKSKILEWCGKHLFPLYSYQKLPMLCFASSFIAAHHLLYVFICLTVTLLIAQLYHFWEIKI